MKITAELLAYAAKKTGVKQAELLEKDMLLHLLLKELAADERFRTHYVFKGGTCLIKCYLGYYRFSEDLDFSYTRQKEFEGKSEKQISRQLSREIDALAGALENLAAKIGLDFKPDKKDRHYMEFGGGNKFTTFKLWYESVELRVAQFIKIQINYVEKFEYPFKQLEAKNIMSGLDERELKFRRPEAAQMLEPLSVQTYDIREILAEKVRAILTRKGTKARDFIDVYLIQKQAKVKPEDIENQIIDKIKFMLKYEKYRRNLMEKKTILPSFKLGDEERLVIKPLDAEFPVQIKKLNKTLEKIISRLSEY